QKPVSRGHRVLRVRNFGGLPMTPARSRRRGSEGLRSPKRLEIMTPFGGFSILVPVGAAASRRPHHAGRFGRIKALMTENFSMSAKACAASLREYSRVIRSRHLNRALCLAITPRARWKRVNSKPQQPRIVACVRLM